jgi:AraC family transcriptional regulator of adaptative response/methylated-DNA-[protein]-cysteine methyltransferase
MNNHYDLILKAITYLSTHFQRQPTLEDLAEHLGMSMYHLQRTFSEWVGISPKRFLQFLTIDYARHLLDQSHSVLDTSFITGVTSPGRIHDLFVSIDAVTPGEFKSRGQGLTIHYGLHESPFGTALLAITDKGLCGLSFHDRENWHEGLAYLKERWRNASLANNPEKTLSYFKRVFSSHPDNTGEPIKLVLKGTNFQLKVWEALLRIPEGHLCSYQHIAEHIGEPDASRAVGNAVGANPISYLIPCHRVIRKNGIIGNYHWGTTRKKAILLWEAAQRCGKDVDDSSA